MGEKRYIISDASKILKVESHVLRYWEEELEINIPRNEMGHRYYTENHLNLLKNIRDLKEQGYGLRTIKMMITDPKDMGRLPEVTVNNNKMEQFQKIMGNIVTRALEESSGNLVTKAIENSTETAVSKAMDKTTETMTKDVSEKVSQKVIKEMDYIIRMQDEKDEARYKRLDEVIRSKQKHIKSDEKMLNKIKKKEAKIQKKEKKDRKKSIKAIFNKNNQTI